MSTLRRVRVARATLSGTRAVLSARRVAEALQALADGRSDSVEEARAQVVVALKEEGAVDGLSAQLVTYLVALNHLGGLFSSGVNLRDSPSAAERQVLAQLQDRYERLVLGGAVRQLDLADRSQDEDGTGLSRPAGQEGYGRDRLFSSARESVETARWLHEAVVNVPETAALSLPQRETLLSDLRQDAARSARRDQEQLIESTLETFRGVPWSERLTAAVSLALLVTGTFALADDVQILQHQATVPGGIAVAVGAVGYLRSLREARSHSASRIEHGLGIASFARMSGADPTDPTAASISRTTSQRVVAVRAPHTVEGGRGV